MKDSIVVALIVAATQVTIGIIHEAYNRKRSRTSNGKLDHIIVLTNSTLTNANARIEFLEKKVAEMLRDVNE